MLCNASPDVGAQIAATSALWPRARRDTPIGAVVLTNGDVDHVAGLFSLRESQPLAIYASAAVRSGLEGNVMLGTLRRFEGQTVWRTIELGVPIELSDVRGVQLGLRMVAVAAPGKLPKHLEVEGERRASAEDNVALFVSDRSGRTLAYVPGCAAAAAAKQLLVQQGDVDCLLLDGAFWTDDELVRQELGTGRATEMAHAPVSGTDGTCAVVTGELARRRIFTHINNTNPILREDSDERRSVTAAGWEVAHDGMELEL